MRATIPPKARKAMAPAALLRRFREARMDSPMLELIRDVMKNDILLSKDAHSGQAQWSGWQSQWSSGWNEDTSATWQVPSAAAAKTERRGATVPPAKAAKGEHPRRGSAAQEVMSKALGSKGKKGSL